MREILFHGKDAENGQWIYGYYIGGSNHIDTHEICDINDVLMCMVEVDPKTVGQFTGLTDKNGKKIFEGDIGRYKQVDGAKRNGKPITCIGKVVYNVKTASFAIESKDETGCKYFDYFPIKDFEVIGNIHDNPELLEGGLTNGYEYEGKVGGVAERNARQRNY